MSDRSWFFASQGQQQGPYPEAQLHDLIAKGIVTAATLVWSEGMADWQKAGDIPGLFSGVSGPPSVPHAQRAPAAAGRAGEGEGSLSIDLELWPLLGRSIVFFIGLLLIVPAPWVATNFYRWMVARIDVPGRPNLTFTGEVGDIWYVFVAIGLITDLGFIGIPYLQYLLIPVQAVLSWMTVRWICANLSSNGQPLQISFGGSALGYVGWQLLLMLSAITIIGWAWVIVAWVRWICRNVDGTRREIVFNATGLETLWRTFVFAIGCGFLIPIPWVLRWYTKWYVSQFELVERAA
jgi:GYF domain 2